MFLRKKSQRYVLLHSVRDGNGRVRHLRLGQFEDAASLGDRLQEPQWRNWQDWFSRQYPEIEVNWSRLRAQAEKMFSEAALSSPLSFAPKREASKSVARLRSAIRALIEALAGESDSQIFQQIRHQLIRLMIQMEPICEEPEGTRPQFLSRRRVYAEGDPEAADYLKTLDDLERSLEMRGMLQECARVLAERVDCCPSPQSRARYGSILQRLGRTREAIEQYEFIPNKDAIRHYNLASASYREGRVEEALNHLSHGLVRDREVANCLKRRRNGPSVQSKHPYWQTFESLWCDSARDFFLQVYSQLSVRWRLRTCSERGVKPRQLLAPLARAKILNQLSERAGCQLQQKWATQVRRANI